MIEMIQTNRGETAKESHESGKIELKEVENLAPGMNCPVIVSDESLNLKIEYMVWGLIPHYFAPDQTNSHYRLFNKRIESFQPSYGNKYFHFLLQRKRCLVVFDGFYEWTGEPGHKQPYYVYVKDSPTLLPAIFEDSVFTDPLTGEIIRKRTFSIITEDPSEAMKPIHERQPVLMTEDQAFAWLNPDTHPFKLLEELKENPQNPRLLINRHLFYHPVTKNMTDVQYQADDCSKQIHLAGEVSTVLSGKKRSPSVENIDSASTMHQPSLNQDGQTTSKQQKIRDENNS
jgi:putative SOS response-associated peptidase YedK